MYDLGPEFQNASVDPGTNLLVSGPPLSGGRRLAFETLAHGARHGDGILVVTTRYSGGRVLSDLEALVDLDDVALGIVDCVTERQGREKLDDRRLSYANSPADLTSIGIKFSELVKEFRVRDIEQTRVVLDSLSALLPYANLQSVFKFMHVLTGQVRDADALGVHVVEASAHEDQELQTLEQLLDGTVTVDDDAVTAVNID